MGVSVTYMLFNDYEAQNLCYVQENSNQLSIPENLTQNIGENPQKTDEW